jgi:hypothetical protein
MKPPQRFSLLSLLLLFTTIVAAAGWWAPQRKAELAWNEVRMLRQKLDQYQAELGELHVVDETKVHAIGLRRAPEDTLRWKWRVFIPPEADFRLYLRTDYVPTVGTVRDPSRGISHQLQGNRELLIEAAIVQRSEADWALVSAINGKPTLEERLPWYQPDANDSRPSLDLSQVVGPDDRNVWEPGETAVLILAKSLSETGGQQSNTSAGFAIWLSEIKPQ